MKNWCRLIPALSSSLLMLTMLVSNICHADLPKTTKEGLELVESAGSDAFYLKPGTSFESYNKVILLDAYVGIDDDWVRDYNRQAMRSRRLRASDLEKIKEQVTKGFKQSFTEQLEAGGYPLVAGAEDGTLILRPAIVKVSLPSYDVSGDTIVQNLNNDNDGAMTLILEVYDAVTSELLARIFNSKASAQIPDFGVESSAVNRAQEERVYRQWATSLIRQMGSL